MTYLKNDGFKSVIACFSAYGFLWACLLVPSFFTFGKIHFVLPVLYAWALRFPQRLPWLVLLVGGAFQDILLELPWGAHGAFYSVFLYTVISQRPSLYNRSFILRWTAFGVILTLTQGGLIVFLSLIGKQGLLTETFVYNILIPWLSFPLLSQITHTYLLGLLKHYV